MRRWKRLNPIALLLACALSVAACGASGSVAVGDGGSTGEADSERAATLLTGEFNTLSGESIDFAELAGEDVVFWFWAPW